MELVYFLLSVLLLGGAVVWIATSEVRSRKRREAEWKRHLSRFGRDLPIPPRKPTISGPNPDDPDLAREHLLARIERMEQRYSNLASQ